MAANTNTVTYSVYVLKEMHTEKVRYVGISCDVIKRFNEHIKEKRRSHRVNWIQSIISKGELPIMEVIEDGLCKEDVLSKEKYYIKLFKSFGAKLTNATIGGEAPMAEKKHTALTRHKMSDGKKGEKNSFWGKKLSKEHKDKLRLAHSGKPTWNKGMKLSSEHKISLKESRSKGIKDGSIKIWNDGESRIDSDQVFYLSAQGIKQREIADKLNCDPSNISRILNNIYQRKKRIGASKVNTI